MKIKTSFLFCVQKKSFGLKKDFFPCQMHFIQQLVSCNETFKPFTQISKDYGIIELYFV